MLTKSQIRAITRVQQEKLRDGIEVKRFSVTQHEPIVHQQAGTVFVAITVGYVGDEGKLASVLCREWGHFAIYPQGRTVALRGASKTTKGRLAKYPLIYGWES